MFVRRPIGELCTVKGGKRLPNGHDFIDDHTQQPYIRARDIKEGKVVVNDPVFIGPDTLEKIKRYTVSGGDVLITIVGANVGDTGAVPPNLAGASLTENAVKVVAGEAMNQSFLRYALLEENVQRQMKTLAGGAAQPKLGIYKVNSVEVFAPPLPTQRRIASILSAYDDLIENNTKRIEILEEMARSLYREWFVHFRFPGHEKVKLVDSELGKIPEGWEVAMLGGLTTLIARGVAPRYVDDGGECVLNQKCIREGRLSLGPSRRHVKEVPAERYVAVGDVLVNSTGVGTLGRVAQVLCELPRTTVDTHVTIVRPSKAVDQHWLGMGLLGMQSAFEAMAVGATGQTELNRARIAEAKHLVPPGTLQREFGTLVQPIRALSLTLETKNDVLRQTRDLLLPKLISGAIDVDALDLPEVG